MYRAKREWVRNPDGVTLGWVWNPITGCLNHTGGLCRGGGFSCYAYRLANTRLKQGYLSNKHTGYDGGAIGRDRWLIDTDPFYPRFWEERLYHPWGGEPKGIFVCDMSDLFGIGIPEEWTNKVLNLCRLHEQNRYYLLTKQPANLVRWSPFPDNCYVGVTATDTEMAVIGMHFLRKIDAPIKFVSFEPLLKQIGQTTLCEICEGFVDWLVIGGQTKPDKLPKIEWVQEIVEAADKASVRVFLKDNLKPLVYYPEHEWAWGKYDNGSCTGLLRQEMPEEVKQWVS